MANEVNPRRLRELAARHAAVAEQALRLASMLEQVDAAAPADRVGSSGALARLFIAPPGEASPARRAHAALARPPRRGTIEHQIALILSARPNHAAPLADIALAAGATESHIGDSLARHPRWFERADNDAWRLAGSAAVSHATPPAQ